MTITDYNKNSNQFFISLLLVIVWTSALIDNSYLLRKILPFGVFKLSSIIFNIYCIILFISRPIIIKGCMFFKNHYLLLFLTTLYWLYSLIGSFYAPVPIYGTEFVAYNIYYIVVTLFSIILVFQLPLEKRKKVIGAIGIIAFSILVFMSIGIYTLRWYNIINLPGISESVFTVFNDRNVYLFNLIISLQFIYLLFDYKKSHQKYLLLVIYLGVIIIISFIGSISGSARSWGIYFPITTFVILYFFVNNKKLFISTYGWLTIFFVVLFISLAMFCLKGRIDNQKLSAPFDRLLGSSILMPLSKNFERSMNLFKDPNDVISKRTSLWVEAYSLFDAYSTNEIIFGRGTRCYLSEPAFFSNNLKPSGKGSTPHNFFLSALLEGGVFKATLILLVIIVWSSHIVGTLKFVAIWEKNLILGSFLLWLVSATISGKDFFNSKIVYLVFLVYATLAKDRVLGSGSD